MKKSRLSFTSSRQSRQRQGRNKVIFAASVGLCTLAIGVTVLGATYDKWSEPLTSWLPFQQQKRIQQEDLANSAVLALVSAPGSNRQAQLEAIATGAKSLAQSRARYLLASDLIKQKQGQKALRWLEGLEADYAVMAPYITLKRSLAYLASGNKAKAQNALRDILKSYPNSPVVPEALYLLGSIDPKSWDKAIAQFPSHPRTLEMVQRRLKQNPKQPQLMLLYAKYAFDSPGIISLLDQLVAQYKASLKRADWEAIGWIYWENLDYSKASAAYARAAWTPINAYRNARGVELSGSKKSAQSGYRALISEFPDSQQAATSLIRLGNISQPPEALTYLEQAIDKFPDRAGEALIEKAKILDQMKNASAAEQARQLLLTKYGSSEEAAEYRWNQAQAKAAAGDLQAAWEWVKQIVAQSPNSQYGPRASFWAGKWASQLGRQDEAKAAFEHTLANYPQSYYAWRSAVFLGWNVGDFTTVRQLDPRIVRPSERSLPPAGSATFKELYQLGQDSDAWTLWQAEFKNRMQPTVAEQFTDGLIRLRVGKYHSGIDRVSKLEDRDSPTEQAEYRDLRQQPAYWYALYPFPFMEIIETWARERKFDPLLVSAVIRQESRFQPAIRSIAGATGLMQVLPSTAEWAAKILKLQQYSLENPSDNVRLGTWYLDHTHEQYNNNSMLAVASYNAGPSNVAKWLKDKGSIDQDQFVETIPFDETKGYVKNVFGNYWNYLRLYNPEINQQLAKHAAAHPTVPR